MRGPSWHHCGPLPPGNALTAGRADTRGPPGHLPVPLPTTVACSYPRWLGPWRDAKQYHLTQRPDMVSEARGHGGRARPPLPGRARAVSHHRGLLIPPPAGARVAHETTTLRATSRHGRSAPPPWRAYRAAPASRSRRRWCARAAATAGVGWHGANRSYSRHDRRLPAAATRPRPCTAC